MPNPEAAPYGSWESPITTDLIVSETVKLGQIALDGDDIYWVEMRPSEAGRNVIVRRTPDGQIMDVTPKDFNARTRAHEYGGGAFAVQDGQIYFCNDQDQRIYSQTVHSSPRALSPKTAFRYADGIIDNRRQRMICILEDHTKPGREEENSLISLSLHDDNDYKVLAAGNDFYSSPTLSPDGKRLAWLTWNHPNMPWDGTELWLAELENDGTVGNSQKLAGGPKESIFQPQWSPDGVLYFVSDNTGWWNLYRFRSGHVEIVLEKAAEFGLPQWVFGMSTYGFESEERLICTFLEKDMSRLGNLNTKTGELQIIELPFTEIDGIRASPGQTVFMAGSPISANAIVRLDLNTNKFEILRRSADVALDFTYFSRPKTIDFPTANGLTAHAFFYPPQNRDYTRPEGELPPLIVKSHGGPTASTSTALELKIQFWSSRGFAILDVNYGGSTGFGREYRQRLNDKWGIIDVEDCINGAKYLVEKGLVDSKRVAISGGSAGGYTTLSALTFHDFFKAGASYYGICDLEALAKDTHKFESKYLDRLVGPYPEKRDTYLERSPIHFTEKLSCPVIIFQGLEDKIVPPNQSEMMVEALRKKGLPVAYVAFEGEQHGFRRAETIKRALEAELYFYSNIFNFKLAEEIEPVHIDNLPEESTL